VESDDTSITVVSDRTYRSTTIKTNPYPGFPTDMHPQFGALLCTSQGISSISEGIFGGNRFKYIEELKKMGADVVVVDNTAHFTGVPTLKGTAVRGSDLRAGAALVIAALGAEGVSTITSINIDNSKVPDVRGMGLSDALYLLESMGMTVTHSGHGAVRTQSIEAGAPLKSNNLKIHLTLK
jgi:UDP-N-acetylglucosamine 1-carboxyvinyltransferase